MSSSQLSYRAEIDGLRAIAVISVILYHAKMVVFGRDWFEGGFIGVDIFFVISGYLITRIIFSELQTKGAFCFLNFYERRARRIFPMLLVVILVSIPYAWQKLSPSDFVEYAESILASLAFGSNFFFYFSTTEYGAESALLKPFLHTWSLSVEEQFYLVFPLLATVAHKFLRKHSLTILVGLSLLSLQFAALMEVRNPDLNFYLPLSRFWELGIGSMLAYRELNYRISDDGIGRQILPMLGLSLILYSILFFDSETPHPSFYTLIPIAGVAFIVKFASKDELVGKVLGSRPFVWIGLISYSAYLWHFPIFAFSRHTSLSHSNYDKLEWIVVTFVLAAVSFYLIEGPLRNASRIKKRAFLILIGLTSIFVVSVSLLIINGVSTTSEKVLIDKLLDNGAFREEHRRFELNYDYSVLKNGKSNILIVGNSHAEDLLKALSFSDINDDFNINLISPIKRVKDVNYQVRCLLEFLDKNDTTCETIEYGPNISEQYSFADVVILASFWRGDDLETLPSSIRKILTDSKKVIVVSNTPQSQTFGEKKLNRFDRFLFESKTMELPTRSQLKEIEEQFYEDYITGQQRVNNKLKAIVESFSSDMVVYKERSDFMCDQAEKRCYMYFPHDEVKVLWDSSHTTTDGARVLGRLITERDWLSDFLQ